MQVTLEQPATALPLLSDVFTKRLRLVCVAAFTIFAVFFTLASRHWPLLDDGPIMHYVNFLMAHGLRPYSDITDNNLPGAYLTEGWAMQLFGGGDLAWRVYDLALLGVLTAAMTVIARPYDWFAGVLGGGLFFAVHAAEGPRYAGEREEVIAVALMVGYAAIFESVRRHKPPLALLFGLTAGLAASIKPTFAPLSFAVLVLAAVELRRQRRVFGAYLAWAAAGAAIIAVLVLQFLLRFHALGDFWYVMHVVVPTYRNLWPATWHNLMVRSVPLLLVPVLGVAGALALGRTARWTWEQWALLLGAVVGLASYFIQRKAFLHHRCTWLACCFLLCALELSAGLRRQGWRRMVACAALLFVCVGLLPRYAQVVLQSGRLPFGELKVALMRDLTTVGGGEPARTLQGQVMCFDLVSGCLNTLYHMGLVESSGFTGDLLFFRTPVTAPVAYYRNLFWERTGQHPPGVLVVTNEWFGQKDSFRKLDTWPEFEQYLREHYTLAITRQLSVVDTMYEPGKLSEARAYRIYVRKNDLGTNSLFPGASALKPEATAALVAGTPEALH